MVNEWTLRDEFISIANRWPLPIIAFLLGSLLGWGISYLLPTPYRAEANLSVAYNADAIYRNPDDYKNWQLQQMSALAIAPDVLQETLIRLQKADPYWEDIQAEDLQKMLDVSWRNTGIWHFAAQNQKPGRASQAVQVWEDVILEKYQQAAARAGELFALDKKLSMINARQTDARWRQLELAGVRDALRGWRASALQLPGDQPLDQLNRWRVWALAARAAGFDPAWKWLLDTFPAPEAAARDYLSWLDQAVTALDGEVQVLQSQISKQEPERVKVYEQYIQASNESRGLSANLVVKRASDSKPQAKALRPSSLIALVGGVLGLLAWMMAWLVRPAFQRPRR